MTICFALPEPVKGISSPASRRANATYYVFHSSVHSRFGNDLRSLCSARDRRIKNFFSFSLFHIVPYGVNITRRFISSDFQAKRKTISTVIDGLINFQDVLSLLRLDRVRVYGNSGSRRRRRQTSGPTLWSGTIYHAHK